MKKKYFLFGLCIVLTLVLLGAIVLLLVVRNAEFGFARQVSDDEATLRMQIVNTAEEWLGCQEEDGTHQPIIDLYNAHEPLAEGYIVQYTDNWCATFGSTVAIQCDLTEIIPTECGCERQIRLFNKMGCWNEEDDYVPLPGDYIFYCTTNKRPGDCTAWSDHVGIVVGTWNGFIKVVEGNNGNKVAYRYIPVNDPMIRGYGLPDYNSKCSE